jgi:hypothetical protein
METETMIESQWFSSTNPHEMLAFLKGNKPTGLAGVLSWFGLGKSKVSARKLQLFACACCRRIWPLLIDERSRQAVEKAELYADGLIDRRTFRQAVEAARAATMAMVRPRAMVGGWLAAAQARATEGVALAFEAADPADEAATWGKEAVRAWSTQAPTTEPIHPTQRPRISYPPINPEGAWIAEGSAQCELLRDLIGNPFRALVLPPSVRTPQAVARAKTIYQDYAFTDLPQLAEVLEQTGCNNPEILQHCRANKEHARGCWVVDFILGK